jgi:hypothetical protein
MAVTGKTNIRRQQEVAAQNGNNRSYNGMVGVSDNTARNVANYQAGYAPSQTVQQAQQQLQQVQAQKPQGYNSKYSGQLDNILQQIQNPGEFKYSFDGDEMFKYYADLYTQKGKQASMDAMGQAAALTGGYGNSYGQMVGQQQYQQNLLPLYDMGLQLRDRAYQQYLDQLGNAKDAYQLTGQAEDRDYARYRDLLGDWERELDRAREDERYEREFDYNDYRAQQDYWTGLAQVENAAYDTEQQRLEAIRQYNQDFEERVREYDADLAEKIREYNESLSWDKEESARDFAQRQYEYNTDNDYRNRYFDWERDVDARDYARRVLENDRDFDRNVFESDRNYNRSVYENDRDYNRNVYENDRNYNRSVLENDRNYWYGVQQDQIANDRADRNYWYGVQQDQIANDRADRQLNWQIDTDARDYNRSVLENDRKFAEDLVTYMLQNGQMPSTDLLSMMGLSEADARAMMPQIAPAAGTGGNGKGGNMTVYESVNGRYYTINGDKVNEIRPENIPDEAIVSDRVIGKDWKSPQTLIAETMNSEAGKKAAQKWAEEQAGKAKTSTGNMFTDFATKVTEAQKKKKK